MPVTNLDEFHRLQALQRQLDEEAARDRARGVYEARLPAQLPPPERPRLGPPADFAPGSNVSQWEEAAMRSMAQQKLENAPVQGPPLSAAPNSRASLDTAQNDYGALAKQEAALIRQINDLQQQLEEIQARKGAALKTVQQPMNPAEPRK